MVSRMSRNRLQRLTPETSRVPEAHRLMELSGAHMPRTSSLYGEWRIPYLMKMLKNSLGRYFEGEGFGWRTAIARRGRTRRQRNRKIHFGAQDNRVPLSAQGLRELETPVR